VIQKKSITWRCVAASGKNDQR